MEKLAAIFRFTLTLLLGPVAAWAHDPGFSTATVDLSSREILVQVSFAPADLTALRSSTLDALAPRCVELRAGTDLLAPKTIEVRTVGADNVEFTLRYPRPRGPAVTLRAPLLEGMPFGHRQALTVRNESGATLTTEILSADHPTAILPSAPDARPAQLARGRGAVAATLLVATLLAFGAVFRSRRSLTAAA